MDLLEFAVEEVERYMGTALPTKYVGLLFEEAVAGGTAGTNFGSHIAIRPKFDVDDDSQEARTAGRIIAHEVAHYYWSDNAAWIDEGMAEYLASESENARVDGLVEVTNSPCAYVGSILALEGLRAERGDAEFACNYSLGERLFRRPAANDGSVELPRRRPQTCTWTRRSKTTPTSSGEHR